MLAHRGADGDRHLDATLARPVEGFLAELGPVPDKRIDFLTALRDNPPARHHRASTGWRA